MDIVIVPELQVQGTPVLNRLGLIFLPLAEVGYGDGDRFGDREDDVFESFRLDLGEHWTVIEGFAHLPKVMDAAAGMCTWCVGEDGVDSSRTFSFHACEDTGAA